MAPSSSLEARSNFSLWTCLLSLFSPRLEFFGVDHGIAITVVLRRHCEWCVVCGTLWCTVVILSRPLGSDVSYNLTHWAPPAPPSQARLGPGARPAPVGSGSGPGELRGLSRTPGAPGVWQLIRKSSNWQEYSWSHQSVLDLTTWVWIESYLHHQHIRQWWQWM